MARDFGAAFVGVNPLHAPQEGAYASSSPYSPTSRLFLNYLAVDLMAVPEMSKTPRGPGPLANPAFQADLDRLREAPLVDYPEVRRIKRKFFDMLFAVLNRGPRPAGGAPQPRGREFRRLCGGKRA